MSTQSRRMTLGGAMLVFSMCLAGCGSSGPKLTPEQKTGGSALCKKAGECAGQALSSSDMNECTKQVAGMLQIFPDPEAFAACIDGLSCSTLENSDTDNSAVLKCVDFDRSSFVCSDTKTLHGCSNSGKCTSISCPDVCSLMGNYTFDHCGSSDDPEKAANICWCRM